MLDRLRVAAIVLAAVLLVAGLGWVQLSAGNGCGPPPAAACQTGGMP